MNGMPGFLLGKKGGVRKMRLLSTEKTWEGLLLAAVIMSCILVLAMLVGNYL
jgi:CDP-diglyceride synthetase